MLILSSPGWSHASTCTVKNRMVLYPLCTFHQKHRCSHTFWRQYRPISRRPFEICNTHAERQYNKHVVVTWNAALERMSGRQDSILIQLQVGLLSCVVTRILLSVIIVTAVQMWKVHNQQEQIKATFGPCLTSESQLKTSSLKTTSQRKLGMSLTHPLTQKPDNQHTW